VFPDKDKNQTTGNWKPATCNRPFLLFRIPNFASGASGFCLKRNAPQVKPKA